MVDPSLFGASFPFYFSQAVAITFEDAIMELCRRSGIALPQLLPCLIGYLWAIVRLCILAPWQINWMLKIDITSSDRTITSASGQNRPAWRSYNI